MALKTLLVDDEPLALEVLEVLLQQIPDVQLVASCESALHALQVLNQKEVDLILLDIQMPGLNGLDFIKTLSHKPKIIIVSAYRNFAVEGFELEVIDYLLKPVAFHRMVKAIQKVIQLQPKQAALAYEAPAPAGRVFQKEPKAAEHVFIKVDKKLVKVMLDTILFIESLKDYVRVITRGESYITYCTLSDFTSQLPQEQFLRAHRSYTIALDKVAQIEGNHVIIDGQYIPLARNRKAKAVERLLK